MNIDKEKKIDVSFIIASYRPQLFKILITIESIMMQKEIEYEIIIADDGSNSDIWKQVIKYFDIRKNKRYKLLISDVNKGTVSNCLNGVVIAKGSYIKLLSPGDCMLHSDSIYRWLNFLKTSKKKWSFCNSLYYSLEDCKTIKLFKVKASPQQLSPYKNNNDIKCMKNYCLYNDIVLGAATLIDRNTLEKYLKIIEGKVKYAEDNIYRIMMIDGVCGTLFQSNEIFYEYGFGVSTSKNKEWGKKLLEDWIKTNLIIEEKNQNKDNRLIKKILIKNKLESNRYIRMLRYYLYTLIRPSFRMTSDKIVETEEIQKVIEKVNSIIDGLS